MQYILWCIQCIYEYNCVYASRVCVSDRICLLRDRPLFRRVPRFQSTADIYAISRFFSFFRRHGTEEMEPE